MAKQEVNDVIFYYEKYGDGSPPIVFISGYTSDHNLWKPFAEKLAEKHEILVFDNQGIGKTEDKDEELTAWKMAENVKALVDKLNLKKPILVGYAMGGNIALAYAILFPDELTQLVMLSSTAKWSSEAVEYVKTLYDAQKDGETKTHYKLLYDKCFGDQYKEKTSFKEFTELMNSAPKIQKLSDNLRQINVLEKFDAEERLSEVKVPVLVISPEEDFLAPPKDGELLVKGIKNAKQIIIENTGHAPFLERPSVIAELLQENLN